MAAVALARAGDSARAQVLADEFEREFPEQSLVRLYWAATARAAAELNRGNPERAPIAGAHFRHWRHPRTCRG